jgi:UDP-N-acetylmuramoyl-L-alanyl-D-glutamate--2,6-diaminopimelate ligase
MTSAHVITYGIDKKADITAKNITTKSDGTSFTIVTREKSIEITMKLIGKFSIYNVLASVAASLASNVPLETAKVAVEGLNGVPGRFELVTVGQDFSVIVDYAHTPDSLENVLTTIQQFATGRIFVVVGCGGDRDRKKRPIMASIAEKYADLAIFTSDNPRSEDPLQIIRDMEDGVEGQSYKTIIDRKAAIEYAIETANTNDVILIAGKGHETYQQIGAETFEFDDRKVAAKALKERVK